MHMGRQEEKIETPFLRLIYFIKLSLYSYFIDYNEISLNKV